LIWTFALTEGFWLVQRLEADHLEETLAGFVGVIVNRLDRTETPAIVLLVTFAATFVAVVAVPNDAISLQLDV
jgi:hypothetical protein